MSSPGKPLNTPITIGHLGVHGPLVLHSFLPWPLWLSLWRLAFGWRGWRRWSLSGMPFRVALLPLMVPFVPVILVLLTSVGLVPASSTFALRLFAIGALARTFALTNPFVTFPSRLSCAFHLEILGPLRVEFTVLCFLKSIGHDGRGFRKVLLDGCIGFALVGDLGSILLKSEAPLVLCEIRQIGKVEVRAEVDDHWHSVPTMNHRRRFPSRIQNRTSKHSELAEWEEPTMMSYLRLVGYIYYGGRDHLP